MVFFHEGNRGTIQPNPEFNSEEACIKLNDSMEGLGTDEAAMTNIVLAHSFKQRMEIRRKYDEIYDRDVIRQIQSELSFDYEQIVVALMTDPQEYILHCINEAVTLSLGEGIVKKLQKATYRKGIAADEYTLMGLLFPRPNREIDEIKKAYRKKFRKHLEKRIASSSNLSLDFRRLIIAMIDCKREESSRVDGEKIFKDVMNLIGSKKEECFHVVFHERSFVHLRQLFDGYHDLTGKPIEHMIENSNFSLDLKEAYAALLKLIRNPSEFFAERLYDAIAGAGTDDDTLIQVMVLRSEVDLADIIKIYQDKYGRPLAKDIQGDTSGDYEDILLKMLRLPEKIVHQDAENNDEDDNKDKQDDDTVTVATEDNNKDNQPQSQEEANNNPASEQIK